MFTYTFLSHVTQLFFQDLPYTDCIATGWGKSTTSGDLTDILLQTKVPIHTNVKYVFRN